MVFHQANCEFYVNVGDILSLHTFLIEIKKKIMYAETEKINTELMLSDVVYRLE